WTGLAPLTTRARAGVAAILFVGTVAVLMATLDMGYTRDESFYFRYAMSYQEWFVSVEDAPDDEAVHRAFSRDPVIRTWVGNFEHPPLMKALFGLSWRAFARKDRDVAVTGRPDAAPTIRVETAPAEGFAVGAEVELLRPLHVGEAPTDPARVIGRARVTERTPRAAVAAVVDGDPAALRDLCRARPGDGAPELHRVRPRAQLPDGDDDPDADADADEAEAPPTAAEPADIVMTTCQAREDRGLAVMDEATAMRFPAILTAGLAVSLTFLLGCELFGWIAGLFGALAFLFTPRHFFHAHLTCFDMPIVAMTLLTLYAFWRSLDDRRWALGAGLAWGVALLTKHNAFFIPVGLILYWLWAGRDRLRFGRDGLRVHVALPPLPISLIAMPVVGLPLWFSFWPKLWYDPMRAVRDYFAFHLEHEHYMQWYFGTPLPQPPFPVSYPFVMTGVTVPEVFLILAVAGVLCLAPPGSLRLWWTALRARVAPTFRERATVFALLNGLLPILLIALPSTPIFGGIKHWMTGMPFILLIAGYGFQAMVLALPWRKLAAPVTAGLLLAQPVAASVSISWAGTGYYNELLMGGLQGGAQHKMMRMFWGFTSLQALPWLNAHAPKNARVWFQDTTWDAYAMYQRMGLLRGDIRYHNGPEGAQIALTEPHKALHENDITLHRDMNVVGPYAEVAQDGVSFLDVYVRPEVAEIIGPSPGFIAP
ncbi:MAG: glycosyltransferase family 39 protein, partial [Myxococcales bacterium]|nr:glycosyltransferase family 39 protein [Myxococcales bacterium]